MSKSALILACVVAIAVPTDSSLGGSRPSLVPSEIDYSTYLGGSAGDSIVDVDVSPDGSIFVVGDTASLTFPVATSNYFLAPAASGLNAFIARIDPTTGAVDFVTVFGGSEHDAAVALDVSSGIPVVVGSTYSSDFPTEGGFDRVNGDGSCAGQDRGCAVDGFVAVFEPDGSGIRFASYTGGSRLDRATGVGIRGDTIWVAGSTASEDLPSPRGGLQRRGGTDFFVMRVRSASGHLLGTTVVGGKGNESWPSLDLRPKRAVLAGVSDSKTFPGKDGRYPRREGSVAGVLATLGNKAGLQSATFIGGGESEAVWGVSSSPDGRIAVAGVSHSTDLPVKHAAQPESGGEAEGFLSVFDPGLRALRISTYLGGGGIDIGWAVDHAKGIGWVVGGATYSPDFPVKQGFQERPLSDCPDFESSNCQDGFIVVIGRDGELRFASYLGGSDSDAVQAVVALPGGRIAMVGTTVSPDFPTVGAPQPTLLGTQDGFLTILSE